MGSKTNISFKHLLEVIGAKNSGQSVEEYRNSRKRRTSLSQKAEQLRGTHPSKWPTLTFNWDLTIDGRVYSFDSPVFLPNERDTYAAREEWKESLRKYELGIVSLDEMDANLCNYSRRDGVTELWELGNSSKLAYVLAHVSEGLPISPPVIKPTKDDDIILVGGHHRYAVAKAVGEKRIPIYCSSVNRIRINELIDVEWIDAIES